jgi:hypothetical protein
MVVWRFYVNRIWKSVIFMLATVYFLLDAVFMTVARLFANWIAAHRIFESLRIRIASLRPYPTLALFAVPLIVLEPVKPVAAYLVGAGHIAMGMTVLVISEVLKLVLVERLFSLSRGKLISIPAFAWTYGRYSQAKEWLESFEAWADRAALERSRPVRRPQLRSGSEGLPEARARLVPAPLTPPCDTFFISSTARKSFPMKWESGFRVQKKP